jgi:hypothetical protein
MKLNTLIRSTAAVCNHKHANRLVLGSYIKVISLYWYAASNEWITPNDEWQRRRKK